MAGHQDEEQALDKERSAETIGMLKAVIDGQTYALAAAGFGVTRTAVERRVKAIAARLCRQVGVEGLTEEATTSVSRLRRRRSEILVALESFDPMSAERRRVHCVVSNDEIAKAALRIRGRSANPNRDIAMFYALFATGARPLEIARLRVRDYLREDGGVRTEAELGPEAAITGRCRSLRFAAERFNESMDGYLRVRVELAQGLGPLSEYRGLDPQSALFLSLAGEGFKITPYGQPGQRRFLCRPILETYRKLFRYAELPGVTPLSVRQAVMAGLYEREGDVEQERCQSDR